MKTNLSKKLLVLSASILTMFAMATSVSACTFFVYQPEEPKCLRDK